MNAKNEMKVLIFCINLPHIADGAVGRENTSCLFFSSQSCKKERKEKWKKLFSK